MGGHAMSFGAEAGPQIYHAFVVVFEDEAGRPLGRFGPTRQPFPAYAAGQHLVVEGAPREITGVRHEVEPRPEPEDWLLRATVVVR